MKAPWKWVLGLLVLAVPALNAAHAHTLSQQLSFSRNNTGIESQKNGLGLTYSKDGTGTLSSFAVDVQASRERVRDNQLTKVRDNKVEQNEFAWKEYQGGDLIIDAVATTLSATFDRITDARLLVSQTKDNRTWNSTFGGGFSQWFIHETLQMSIDISRTLMARPVAQVLAEDSQTITPPALYESTGSSLSFRHLATPTTIMLYGWSHIEANDRPPADTYSVSWRQFVPFLKSAVHVDVARALNRGRVTTASEFGQVDAWIGEIAYLQHLWEGAKARIGYRQYREIEVTRAFNDVYQVGSDLVAVGMSQNLEKGVLANLQTPLSLDLKYSQYQTNEIDRYGTKIAASTYEAGVTAKF